MKTSIFEQLSNSIERLQGRVFRVFHIRSSITLLLALSLLWSLLIPFHAQANIVDRKPRGVTTRTVPQSETFTVYGPHHFDRHTGQPVNVVENFSVPSDAAAPFSIQIQNGDSNGSNRVSSATIRLNGADVFTPANFNQTVGSLSKAVSLLSTNALEVKLTSAPGSYLTVSFTATRQAASPSLSSVTPGRTSQGQTLNVTFHGSNTHWVAGQTRASLGAEVVVGGAPQGELGPITVVDSVTAVASVSVSPTAALEPRTAKVVTGQESVSLAESFTVDPLVPPGAASSNVSTIAGSTGVAGFADGSGSAARFRKLTGIAIGSDDAIYIADSGNHRVRVARTQDGATWNVITLAGSGTAGFADGAGTAAQFNNPQGVAVDNGGIVYVADTANNRIRRIATDGTVSTLAGDGTAGFQDGPGAQARFNAPQGIVTDNQGDIYVADTGNSSVRMINAAGVVSTAAGNGTVGSNDSPSARFDGLVGIAVDGVHVYVYLADTGNHRIRRLDLTGTVITIAGAERGFKDGSGSEARFAEPSGIAIDGASKIVVADAVNSLVRLVDPDLAPSGSNQAVTTIAGTGSRGLTDGAGDIARFFTPRGVAVSSSSAIIVADTGNQMLRRILLPPSIDSITPPSARVGDTVTIIGARFDGRSAARNTVRFARSGGGQTIAQVTQATRTALTVSVPADAATGPVTVQTEGGTATSPSDFVVQSFPAPVINDFNPKRGPVGTQVTIAGTNLKVSANDPSVTFAGSNGRLPALVSSASATEVRVTVPNGAITGLIELTHIGGTAATATPFTVDSEQDFQLTVAPSAANAVQGSAATYIVYLTSQQTTFSQLASLTVTGLPNGITASFNPSQITAGASSTLTLNISGNLAPSSYPFTIHGVASVGGQNVAHTAGATLNVMGGGQTTLSGRVLSTDKEPIIGATASLDGHTAMTDAAGAFLLTGVTAGTNRPLMVDGRTASSPNRTYPVIIEPANIVAGQANVVPYTFYLPPIDTQYEVEVVPGQNTVAANPRVPGLQMTIPAGANLRNRDGSPVARVSITPLAIDRTPAPLPAGIKTGLVYTSQPGGALTDIPLPVVYPNLLGVDPGTRVELYAFNHDTVQWYIYGYGRVSANGRTIAPEIDPNTGRPYGLRDFSWHFPNASPNGNGGGGGGGCDSCPCSRGPKPVDYSTGIKFETATDVAFGGARGGIEISRFYSSDNSAQAILGRFGRGWKDGYDFRLTGSWTVGGAGRAISPDEQTGRLFGYSRTETDGTLVFTSTDTVGQLGDVIRKLSNGTLEYRTKVGDVMQFTAGGQLTSTIDRNGNTTTFSYVGANLTQITDPVGRSVSLTYDSNGRVIKVTDPIGREWLYTYDESLAFGILSTVTDPLGKVTRYGYTGLRLSSITDPRGNPAKRITYDAAGRVISQQFADGGTEHYDYILSGAVVTSTTITDTLGRKTTKRFNASGYVIGQVDALGQTSTVDRSLDTNLPNSTSGACGCAEVTRQFDSRGNVTSITDRLGHTERYEYDSVFNNVTKKTDKLGHVTLYNYDSRGNLTSLTQVTTQGNFTYTYAYNAYGEVTSETDPLNHAITFEYDAQGNVAATVDALGHRSESEYDAIGRQTSISDPLLRRSSMTYNQLYLTDIKDSAQATTHFEYDENGNQTSRVDALEHRWRSVFDSKNRLQSVVDPLGRKTSLGYTTADELSTIVSAAGRTTRYGYDARGQVTSIIDPSGAEIRLTYNNRGNLTALSDQKGNTTTYVYDEMFRPIATRNPLGQLSTVEYDAMGRLTLAVDRLGRRTSMIYDERNRLAQNTFQDATVTYSFDAASRLTEVQDSQSGGIQWAYDDADRLISETTPGGVVGYTYNDAGDRLTMAASDRPVVSHSYDAAGRLQTITQGGATFAYSYDILSRRTSLDRPNGVRTTYEYDEVDRLVRLLHQKTGNNPVEDFRLTYNRDDEIDSISSLSSATVLPDESTASAANAANQVGQFSNATYGFNSLGQTTSKTNAQGTTNYDWDARGRLSRVTLPTGENLNYSYDALGRRTSATAAGVTTNFMYDGMDVVLDRATDGSSIDYVNGPHVDEKLSQTSGATPLYFVPDYLGSTAALTDAGGNVAERAQYQPFGAASTSQLTRYGYTGRETDARSGLMYYRSRWYDPSQGRFLSEDPLGIMAGPNLYSYVYNYPMGLGDPSGQQAGAAPALAPAPPPVTAPIPPPVVVPAAAAEGGALSTGAATVGGASAGTIGVVVVGGLVIGWVAGRGIGHIPIGSGRTVDTAVQDWFIDNVWGRPVSPPMPTPRAKAEPDAKAKPVPVPEERGSGKWTCLVRCNITKMKDAHCDCPDTVEGIGHGPTRGDAEYNGEQAAKATFAAIAAGRKLNCRTQHCHAIWCVKR
jgi:RHS repeat-associated protein